MFKFHKEKKIDNKQIKESKPMAIIAHKETATKENRARSKFVLKRKNAMKKIVQKNEFDYLILEKIINENLNEEEEEQENNDYLDQSYSQHEIEYNVSIIKI